MKKAKISFKVDPNEIALNQRKFTTSEIGRGIGVIQSKKGKGSYKRSEKFRKDRRNQDYGDFVYFIFCGVHKSHRYLFTSKELYNSKAC